MEKQNPKPSGGAATFVKCLGCSKLVRLPSDPDPNAMARCPRCGDTYQIDKLLDAEIPELEVLESQSSPPAIVAFESGEVSKNEEVVEKDELNRFIVAPALAKGAKRKKRRRSSSSESESDSPKQIKTGVSIDKGNGESRSDSRKSSSRSSSSRGSSSSSSSRRSSSSSRSRSRSTSQSSSGGFEVFKILFGACMAPPVAQLVIWWVLGMDPLGLGPAASKYFPPLVPAAFHAEASEESQAGENRKAEKRSVAAPGDEGYSPYIDEELPPAPRDIENRGFN